MISLLPWGHFYSGTTFLSSPNPPTVVVSERPCGALIVEATEMRAGYAKPPVNPIKWSELPLVWRESPICFQDMSA